MTTTQTTAEIARDIIMATPWGAPIRVVLNDGSERIGTFKHRSRRPERGFTLSDSIWTIPYADVKEIEHS